MKQIINLTQHTATAEQVEAGVVQFPELQGDCLASSYGFRPDQFGYYTSLTDLLTFESIDSTVSAWNRAVLLAIITKKLGYKTAMIGGAPFFMPLLEQALAQNGILPVYAFSQRESVEKVVDGQVIKTNVFKHVGFVEARVKLGFPDSIESD